MEREKYLQSRQLPLGMKTEPRISQAGAIIITPMTFSWYILTAWHLCRGTSLPSMIFITQLIWATIISFPICHSQPTSHSRKLRPFSWQIIRDKHKSQFFLQVLWNINNLYTLFLPSFRSLRSSFSSSVTFLSRMLLSFVLELLSFFSGFSILPPPRDMASSNCCCLRSSCLELCRQTQLEGKTNGRLFGEQQQLHPTWPAGLTASSCGCGGESFPSLLAYQ